MPPSLIFLEASDSVLHRRFSETRRPHPLAPDEPIGDAIALERRKMARIRAMADEIVDTSDLTVHELRQVFLALSRDPQAPRPAWSSPSRASASSTGCRSAPTWSSTCASCPTRISCPSCGRRPAAMPPVAAFLKRQPATTPAAPPPDRRSSEFLLPQYVAEGKSYVTVGIGCTGGRHRSVYIAEALRRATSDLAGVTARVRHRDIGREGRVA